MPYKAYPTLHLRSAQNKSGAFFPHRRDVACNVALLELIHAPKKNEHRGPGSFSRCSRCFSRKTNRSLLHHDLAAGIELALHAYALAFELGNIGLVIDVIRLASVIFQHVLVALLHNRAREGLRATRGVTR
jgi:hypothetical protein